MQLSSVFSNLQPFYTATFPLTNRNQCARVEKRFGLPLQEKVRRVLYQIDFKTQARRASATRQEEGGELVWRAVARGRKLLHFNSREETFTN